MGQTLSSKLSYEMLPIMEYLDWNDRVSNIRLINKRWSSFASTTEYYRWLSKRLSEEHGVYISHSFASGTINLNWRSIFREFYIMRSIWSPKNDADEVQKNSFFKINVSARFRPESARHERKAIDEDEGDAEEEVSLPLHQRLAMIKMARNVKSNREALKVLAYEGGWFKDKWVAVAASKQYSKECSSYESTSEQNNTNKENELHNSEADLNVASKIANEFGKRHGTTERTYASVHSVDAGSGRVVMIAPDVGLREFSFDGVLPKSASQNHVYDTSARRLVMDFMNGYNAVLIAYGQTGSGKSYTMFGPEAPDESTGSADKINAGAAGIVPRACAEILQAIAQRRETLGIQSRLAVSYVEVFGDQVSDLLRKGARCGQSKVAAQRYVLSGAAEHVVTSMEDVHSALQAGEAQKRHAATAMNERSSRAHSLFIITLVQEREVGLSFSSKSKRQQQEARSVSTVPSLREASQDEGVVTRSSRLFLVDLGGSEQVKKSAVEAGAHRVIGENSQYSAGFELGVNMREAVNINLGLLALKKSIEALNNGSLYVPYQDSKLTMLLSEGLGGNSKTSVILCASMDPQNSSETMATLRFGERCSLVEKEARNNATMLASVLAELDRRVGALEAKIREKERWVVKEETRIDTLAETGTVEAAVGGVEVKKAFLLVGAEHERRELEALLKQRAKFIGSGDFDDDDDDDSVRDRGKGNNSINEVFRKPKKSAVVGFGKEYAELYGLGKKYNENDELEGENSRFEGRVDIAALPKAVIARASHRRAAASSAGRYSSTLNDAGTKATDGLQWQTGEALERGGEASRKKLDAKRNKLVYAGLSA